MKLLIDSMDGIYFLASKYFDSSEPPVPARSGVAAVAVDLDIVAISTYGSWSPVDVLADETPFDVRPDAPDAWEAILEGEVSARGPLALFNMEFEPVGGPTPQITSSGGRFGLRVMARSAQRVRELGTVVEDEATEQHVIYLWRKGPLDGDRDG